MHYLHNHKIFAKNSSIQKGDFLRATTRMVKGQMLEDIVFADVMDALSYNTINDWLVHLYFFKNLETSKFRIGILTLYCDQLRVIAVGSVKEWMLNGYFLFFLLLVFFFTESRGSGSLETCCKTPVRPTMYFSNRTSR